MSIKPKCESCGELADGVDLMGVPLCNSCGILSEANQSKEEREWVERFLDSNS